MQQQMKQKAEHAQSFKSILSTAAFTIVNGPENLAEGAGADRLLVVICRECSGQIVD